MSDECFYEEISSIVARVSGRTLKMKTNNVKLLNKIGFELSSILSKVNDIVRLYQADKNDFISDVELIQRDYIDISRKIDERFSQNQQQLTELPSKEDSQQSTTTNQTNLQRILNTSNSSVEDKESDDRTRTTQSNSKNKTKKKKKERKSKASTKSAADNQQMDTSEVSQHETTHEEQENEFGLMIPDTCAFDYMPKKIAQGTNNKALMSSDKFIIRETVDSNECLDTGHTEQQTVIDPSDFENNIESMGSDLDKTQDMEVSTGQTKPKQSSQSKKIIAAKGTQITQGTPMAVKKKLQEYGLLDMTNSPEKMSQSARDSPCKSTLNTFRAGLSMNVSPCSSPSVVQKPKSTSAIDKVLTPVKYKLMLDKTPNKSPSLIFKTSTDQQTAVNISTFDVSKTTKAKSSGKKMYAPGTDKTFDCQFDLLNEIPSPMKSTNKSMAHQLQQQTNSSKTKKTRMKQLTMSQAFAVQKTTPTKKPTEAAASVNVPADTDLDETCLPDSIAISKPNFTSVNRTNEIKSEPMDFGSKEAGGDVTTSKSVNSMKLKKIKPEPMVTAEETTTMGVETSPIVNSLARPTMNDETCLESDQNNRTDYFTDFDKVPKKKDDGPAYKHVQVVRKQDERKKLGTSSCKECENYWNSLPEDKRPQRMDDMCRHRAKYQAPDTPEHYWSIAFPNTQDCIDRGYGGILVEPDKNDSASRRPRRKRPLKLQSNENKKKREDNDPATTDFDFGDED